MPINKKGIVIYVTIFVLEGVNDDPVQIFLEMSGFAQVIVEIRYLVYNIQNLGNGKT